MARNSGTTSLKRRRRPGNPMQDYDLLPTELRTWIATADLPWGAQSVRRAYENAVARTGCKSEALSELDALQARLMAKDAVKVWGEGYPS